MIDRPAVVRRLATTALALILGVVEAQSCAYHAVSAPILTIGYPGSG